MWTANIQFGVDLATALSVIGASFAYIIETRRSRKIEHLDRIKSAILRENQFKIEKVSEIINTLSDKERMMRDICAQIDLRIRAIESPDDVDLFIIKLTEEEKNRIYSLALNPDHDCRFLPDEFKVTDLVKSLLNLLRETVLYLECNPYIRYILNDENASKRVEKFIALHEYHGTISGKNASNRKTLYMVINEIVNHPFALGGYIYAKCQGEHKIINNGRNVMTTINEIKNSTRNIIERESAKLLSKAYQLDFLEMDNSDKKAKIYKNFVLHRLDVILKKRDVWNSIADELNYTIKSLADYTYTTISDPGK